MYGEKDQPGTSLSSLLAGNVDKRTREKLVRLFREHHPNMHKLLAARNW